MYTGALVPRVVGENSRAQAVKERPASPARRTEARARLITDLKSLGIRRLDTEDTCQTNDQTSHSTNCPAGVPNTSLPSSTGGSTESVHTQANQNPMRKANRTSHPRLAEEVCRVGTNRLCADTRRRETSVYANEGMTTRHPMRVIRQSLSSERLQTSRFPGAASVIMYATSRTAPLATRTAAEVLTAVPGVIHTRVSRSRLFLRGFI